ncbi:hypothetical protein [Nostoc sp. UHCC 0251]|uniref:hypothetical protein n=1 Tax=Nostoc sp. UHCC 0251 TaxID=3110240 RepID=UPI002B20AAC4|nr:hypothetical protein [Nostoc sp. UHCC 0251]MEA5624512.1 hypothetical protein [Nostoc sp. UHCC 0251]
MFISLINFYTYLPLLDTLVQNDIRKPHSVIFYDTLLKLSTDAYLCIYLGYSYTDDLCGAEGVEMKCILIDSEQGDQELSEQGVEDLFQVEDRLFLTQS